MDDVCNCLLFSIYVRVRMHLRKSLTYLTTLCIKYQTSYNTLKFILFCIFQVIINLVKVMEWFAQEYGTPNKSDGHKMSWNIKT